MAARCVSWNMVLLGFTLLAAQCLRSHQLYLDEQSAQKKVQESLQHYIKNQRPRPLSYLRKQKQIPARLLDSTIVKEDTLIVEVNMYLLSFGEIDVNRMQYTVTMLLRQRWMDPRICYGHEFNVTKLSITTHKDKLWLPDLYFRNSASGKLQEITQDNVLLWIDSKGVITYSQKLTVTFSCYMNLWKFPFDSQTCPMSISSFAHTTDDMAFRWWETREYDVYGEVHDSSRGGDEDEVAAFEVTPRLQLNEFELVDYEPHACQLRFKKTGNFTCIAVHFNLRRKFGFHIVYTYMPTLVILVLAWLSFFIDYKAAPARVSICMLCTLALVTQSLAALNSLPRVSYVKAIDVWLFGSLTLIMVTFFEYAFVSRLHQLSIQRLPQPPTKTTTGDNTSSSNACKTTRWWKRAMRQLGLMTPERVDSLFIKVYPGLVVCFVSAYSLFYVLS